MKNILTISALLLFAASLQGQVIRTVGIAYTAGAPAFTPSASGSFIAYDTTGRDFYEFFGGVWSKAGQNIDQIAGAVAPAYTPTKMDARFAINASGQLYWWNGSAWVQVGGGSGATDLTFTGSSSPFTLNSSTGTDVTFAQGGIVSLTRNNNELTISATEVDGSVSNEGVIGVGAGGANTATIISNTSGANDVTIAGATSIAVTETTNSNGGTINIEVADDGVTFAKMQEISGQHLIGRHSSGSGDIQEVSVGNGVEFQGSGIRRSALTGDVTASAGSNTTTIANSAVTFAKIQDLAGLSVIGRSANTTGVTAAITAASDHQVLRRSGTSIGFGAVNLAQSNAVTGTLPVLLGGTGQTSYTNGQLLIGNTTGNTLTKATLTAGHHTTVTNGAGSIAIGTAQDTLCMIIACSDETTNLTTGKKVTFRAPFRMNIVSLGANVNTAPTGTGITVNIKEGPSDIMSTKLTIADGSFTSVGGSPPVITDTDIAADAECTIEIDAVGSTAAGKGLKVHIYYTKLY